MFYNLVRVWNIKHASHYGFVLVKYTTYHLKIIVFLLHARVNLGPTHIKSSPLFTFSTKSIGQDSPLVHLFSITVGSRFTAAKIKLGEDSPSWFVFSRSRFTFKEKKNEKIKRPFIQDLLCFKFYKKKVTMFKTKITWRFTNSKIYAPQGSTSRWRRIFDDPWGEWVQGIHWRLH